MLHAHRDDIYSIDCGHLVCMQLKQLRVPVKQFIFCLFCPGRVNVLTHIDPKYPVLILEHRKV